MGMPAVVMPALSVPSTPGLPRLGKSYMTRWAEFAKFVGLRIWKSTVKLMVPLEFFGPRSMSVINALWFDLICEGAGHDLVGSQRPEARRLTVHDRTYLSVPRPFTDKQIVIARSRRSRNSGNALLAQAKADVQSIMTKQDEKQRCLPHAYLSFFKPRIPDSNR